MATLQEDSSRVSSSVPSDPLIPSSVPPPTSSPPFSLSLALSSASCDPIVTNSVPPTSSSTSHDAVVSTSAPYMDPPSVIKKLDPALGESGCIKNPQEVPKVVSFMKESSNLMVNRCIVLNVIKATDAPSTLSKFMDVGGWAMLNVWLAEAKKAQNTSLLTELLLVLQKLPVSIEALKQGNMGKLIKQLSKQETGEVQSLAGDLLAKWMTVFREGQSSKSKSADEHRSSLGEDETSGKTTAQKKEKKSSGKKKDKGKGETGPPPEAMQLPPGPLVALGRPKDRNLKRPRDLLGGQSQAEKKSKPSPGHETKSGKGFMESEGFMNALSTQAAKMKEKKIKKVPKIPRASRTGSTSDPLSESKQQEQSQATPPVEGSQPETEDMETGSDDPTKKKKKVTWASDDSLTKMHYFEMDESERGHVNRPTSFLDAANKEKMREREALASGLMFSRDRLIEMIPWHSPQVLEAQAELVERGLESKERTVQAEREGKVLAQLFLNKSSVPPSPLEPDPEPDIVVTEPKFIPLMEPNASGNQNQPPPFASPTHLPHGSSVSIPPDSPLPSPATTINQAQSLINYFSEHGNNVAPPPGQSNHRGDRDPAKAPPGPPTYHQGPDSSNYYPPSQGFSPQQQGDVPPPPGQWGPSEGGGGGYYGNGYFRGQSDPPDPPMRRGRGFGPPRGGRGRGSWRRGLICKHFITHGCKLGTRCRFLHCTPEELADKMATNEPAFPHRHPRGRGGGGGSRYEGPPQRHLEYRNEDTYAISNDSPQSGTDSPNSSQQHSGPPQETIASKKSKADSEQLTH